MRRAAFSLPQPRVSPNGPGAAAAPPDPQFTHIAYTAGAALASTLVP